MKKTTKPRGGCGGCKRRDGTHTETCPRRVCKLCERVAPDKCKHHGGPDHSTARRGKGRAAAKKPPPTPARSTKPVRAVSLPRNGLAAEIARLKAVVAAGRVAEAELAAIKKALTEAL